VGRVVLIVDENAPDAIADFFVSHGYTAYLVRERFGAGTPDRVIARAASEMSAVVVTCDRDYRRLAGWTTKPPNTRYPGMGLIVLSGPEPMGVDLIRRFLPMIEAAWDIVQGSSDPRLRVELSPSNITVRSLLDSS
jgi:hypothetical protein